MHIEDVVSLFCHVFLHLVFHLPTPDIATQSHLTLLPPSNTTAHFHGTLDIKTLGGAGFASQRTTTTTQTWDLSAYSGINLVIGNGDEKTYTFILKDSLPATYYDEEKGREREEATVSWEVDFKVPKSERASEGDEVGEEEGIGKRKETVVFIPWKEFRPTYRGKEKKDAKPIDLKGVRRMSVMMRR
jgi:Complex I intermediate-associated protein 30 (CIA30)